MKALLIYPTHDNCDEVLEPYLESGVHAACYPPRTIDGDVDRLPNCWNEDANHPEAIGLPVVKTVCPTCKHRDQCLSNGYLAQLLNVKNADVVLATHKRVEFTGLSEMAQGRNYVSIHEDVTQLLRPSAEICMSDLVQAQLLIGYHLLSDPAALNWFGDAKCVDDEGNVYEDEELKIRKDRQYQYCFLLSEMLDDLHRAIETAEKSIPWAPPRTAKCPTGIERTLFFGIRRAKINFSDQPWRFLLQAASGKFHSAAIIVERRYYKGGGQDNFFLKKSVFGVIDNPPPTGCVTWINDATIDIEHLEKILGRPVHDATPGGRIERRKKAVQITRDITRRTSPKTVCNVIRGVLADRPQFCCIGIIGHSNHVTALKNLGAGFDDRVVKISYFGSGEDRSSNNWHQKCELIIVAGTPRIPPGAVARYLVQVGDTEAASRLPEWGIVYWQGETESNEPVKVKSPGYRDEAWRRAHRNLVRAQIVQAIGRGRGILETGCEVLVLSNEECGLPLSDTGVEILNASSAAILNVIRELTALNANKNILGFGAVNSSVIAQTVRMHPRTVRKHLCELDLRGLVQKVGERSGWRLVVNATEESSPCA